MYSLLETRQRSNYEDLGSIGGVIFEDHLLFSNKFKRGGIYYQALKNDRKQGLAGPHFWSSGISDANFKNIFAIGDIHGDFVSLLSSLYIAKVIDVNGNWIARDTIVIQLGDILDRERPGIESTNTSQNPREEIDIIQYIYGIDFQARKINSRIISLCGNHDLWPFQNHGPSLQDRAKYVGYPLKVYGGMRKRDQYFRSDGMRNYMAIYRPPILKASEWLAMHGGISNKNFMKGINQLQGLIEQDEETQFSPMKLLGEQWVSGMTHPRRPFPKFILDAMYNRYWARGPTSDFQQNSCSNNLMDMLRFFDIDGDGGLLLGHTPMWVVGSKTEMHSVEVVCNRNCEGDACGVVLADVAQSEGFHPDVDVSQLDGESLRKHQDEMIKSTSILWIVRDRKRNRSLSLHRITSGLVEDGIFRYISTFEKNKGWSLKRQDR